MKRKYTLLIILLGIAIASSAYILAKTNSGAGCTGACKPAVPSDSSGGGSEMNEPSFHHFIVSTFR